MSNDTAKPTDTFGRAVARLRKKAGYSTQKAFSAAIGPGGAMVPRIESGESAGGAADEIERLRADRDDPDDGHDWETDRLD
jgi:hypothetical protein